MDGYDYGMNGWMWVWPVVAVIGILALIGGLTWAILAAVPRPRSAQFPSIDDQGRARQILDQRYARGELGTEEYRERAQALGG
jgi:putative membrane protein